MAMVGARTAQARVCVRTPAPFATQSELAALQTRVTTLETLSTGTITAGTGVNILSQTLRKQGGIVTGFIVMHFPSNQPQGATIFTLPTGFRPPQQIHGVMLLRLQNSANHTVGGGLTINTNGTVTILNNPSNTTRHGGDAANFNYIANFTFIQ